MLLIRLVQPSSACSHALSYILKRCFRDLVSHILQSINNKNEGCFFSLRLSIHFGMFCYQAEDIFQLFVILIMAEEPGDHSNSLSLICISLRVSQGVAIP